MNMEKYIEKMILTNETDIYAYFEIIEEAQVNDILDVGMFLKRIGAVSRQIKDKELPQETKLTGVDFFEEISLPAWNKVYDEIYKGKEFFTPKNQRKYELAVVMKAEQCLTRTESLQMWEWLSSHVSYIVTDWAEGCQKLLGRGTAREIKIDDAAYWFIIL